MEEAKEYWSGYPGPGAARLALRGVLCCEVPRVSARVVFPGFAPCQPSSRRLLHMGVG